MMLIYLNEERWAQNSTEEKNQVHAECGAWHEELVRTGQSKGATALQPAAVTTCVRKREGKVVVTDGPFAETKEMLGGFEMLECKDREEAVAIAGRFPGLGRGCSVELRPLMTQACED